MEKRNLLFLSGGLDSTAMAIMTLKNEPDIITDFVHLTLRNNSNRWEQELTSCNLIIKWLRNAYSNFTYREYKCDYTGLGVKDAEWVGIYSSFIILSNKNLYKKVIIGQIKNDDIFRFECNMLTRRTYVGTLLNNKQNYELPDYYFPLRNLYKKDIINYLKQENFPFEYCFSCRNPGPNNTTCGICLSCQHRKEAGI